MFLHNLKFLILLQRFKNFAAKKIRGFIFLLCFIANSLVHFFLFSSWNKERNATRKGRGGEEDKSSFTVIIKKYRNVSFGKKTFKPQIRMAPHVTSITTYFMAILKGNHRGWNTSREEQFFSFILSHSSEQWLQSFAETESHAKHTGTVNLMSRSDTEHLPRADHLGLQDFSLQTHHNM